MTSADQEPILNIPRWARVGGMLLILGLGAYRYNPFKGEGCPKPVAMTNFWGALDELGGIEGVLDDSQEIDPARKRVVLMTAGDQETYNSDIPVGDVVVMPVATEDCPGVARGDEPGTG